MKICYLVLLFSGLYFQCYAQLYSQYDSLGLKQGVWVYHIEGDDRIGIGDSSIVVTNFYRDTIDGFYRIYSKDVLRYEVYQSMGVNEGLGYVYYSNGKLARIYSFVEGNLVLISLFDARGRVNEVFEVKNEKVEGMHLIFDRKGELHQTKYIENGMLEGLSKYIINGRVDYGIYFKADTARGVFTDGELDLPR